MKLAIRSLRASIIGLLVIGGVVFGFAGTLAYWQGWLFIAVFTAATTIITIYLGLTNPALLERRLRAGPRAEPRPAQKAIISVAFVGFFAVLAISGLDYRFGWSIVPAWTSVLGNSLVAAGLLIDLLVFRENHYGASTIRIMEGQTVISTGPYAVVRHPMYSGVLIMVIGMPLGLGSYWGLTLLMLIAPILMLRIIDEETMLRQELEGYVEYARRVRYRLVPGLW